MLYYFNWNWKVHVGIDFVLENKKQNKMFYSSKYYRYSLLQFDAHTPSGAWAPHVWLFPSILFLNSHIYYIVLNLLYSGSLRTLCMLNVAWRETGSLLLQPSIDNFTNCYYRRAHRKNTYKKIFWLTMWILWQYLDRRCLVNYHDNYKAWHIFKSKPLGCKSLFVITIYFCSVIKKIIGIHRFSPNHYLYLLRYEEKHWNT